MFLKVPKKLSNLRTKIAFEAEDNCVEAEDKCVEAEDKCHAISRGREEN